MVFWIQECLKFFPCKLAVTLLHVTPRRLTPGFVGTVCFRRAGKPALPFAVGQVTLTLRTLKQQNLISGCSQLRSPQLSWGPGWPGSPTLPHSGCQPGWPTHPKARPGPPPRPPSGPCCLGLSVQQLPAWRLASPERGLPKTEALVSSRSEVLLPVPRLRSVPWKPRVPGLSRGRWGSPGSVLCSLSSVRSKEGSTPGRDRWGVTGLLGEESWF